MHLIVFVLLANTSGVRKEFWRIANFQFRRLITVDWRAWRPTLGLASTCIATLASPCCGRQVNRGVEPPWDRVPAPSSLGRNKLTSPLQLTLRRPQ
jgi:hypothetical protein